MPKRHDKFPGQTKKVFVKGQSPPQELEVRHGRMKLTRTYGTDMDSWYIALQGSTKNPLPKVKLGQTLNLRHFDKNKGSKLPF